MKKPISTNVKGLRQRQRTDGSWRVWWEPSAEARANGAKPVELDPNKPTWSVRQCEVLNGNAAAETSGGKRHKKSRTVSELIDRYQASSMFTEDLSDATKRGYRNMMEVIRKKWGSDHVIEFNKGLMRNWYETLKKNSGPTYARLVLRTFSVLFTYSEFIGWRPDHSNPCLKLKMSGAPKRTRTASWTEYDALICAADSLNMPSMKIAIMLATFQGQRQADIISCAVDAFHTTNENGSSYLVWQLVRSKRGNMGTMPIHPEIQGAVQAELDAAKAQDREVLIIDQDTGQAFSGDQFRKRWGMIRTVAAITIPEIKTLQFRDLRRTFGVWARAGGVSRDDAADVLGNSAGTSPELGERYMPTTFATATRAVFAIQRPETKKKTA